MLHLLMSNVFFTTMALHLASCGIISHHGIIWHPFGIITPARGVLEIRGGEDLWQWSRLEIRLKAFRRPTIPQKQFIFIFIIISLLSKHSMTFNPFYVDWRHFMILEITLKLWNIYIWKRNSISRKLTIAATFETKFC